MPNEKSFTQTLAELRDGGVVVELTESCTKAIASCEETGAKCKLKLELEFKPLTKNMSNPAVQVTAKVDLVLPKVVAPGTLFFIDRNGQPSRRPDDQAELPGLTIAKA